MIVSYHRCVCVHVSHPISFWIPETIFTKFGMYIMAPELNSAAYIICSSYQSVCLYVYPAIFARQRFCKTFPW
jgi:hypothetical protein